MTTRRRSRNADEPARCSFCNKSVFEIERLVAGPLAAICDECIRVCVEMVGETASTERTAPGIRVGWPADVYCSLCRTELADDAIPVEGRGIVCRACAKGVRRALGQRENKRR